MAWAAPGYAEDGRLAAARPPPGPTGPARPRRALLGPPRWGMSRPAGASQCGVGSWPAPGRLSARALPSPSRRPPGDQGKSAHAGCPGAAGEPGGAGSGRWRQQLAPAKPGVRCGRDVAQQSLPRSGSPSSWPPGRPFRSQPLPCMRRVARRGRRRSISGWAPRWRLAPAGREPTRDSAAPAPRRSAAVPARQSGSSNQEDHGGTMAWRHGGTACHNSAPLDTDMVDDEDFPRGDQPLYGSRPGHVSDVPPSMSAASTCPRGRSATLAGGSADGRAAGGAARRCSRDLAVPA